jgi:membrane peptidoglycan carboxypeptidase
VRLSLDLELQQQADKALKDRTGALVLLNAQTGEILAMASHPTFDANQLAQQWEDLVDHPASPLLNRALLGRYALGKLEKGLFPQGFSNLELDAPPRLNLEVGDGRTAGVSPLQVALAAAAISNDGVRPPPQLVTAVNNSETGWIMLSPQEEPRRVVEPSVARQIANALADDSGELWQLTAAVENGPGQWVTWYIGGVLPGAPGMTYALALVLEENDLEAAARIGESVLTTIALP